MAQLKDVSVIVVTYNSEFHIYDCLASILRYNDIGERLEIIVVDNGSKCGEEMFAQLCAKYGNQVVLIKNERNGGYGQGNNLGVLRSVAPILMVMNPDVRLMQPVFAKAIGAFARNSNLAMYGMKQMRTSKKPGSSFQAYSTSPVLYQFIMNSACNKLDWYYERMMSLQGACFFVRREVFLEIGLFDERLFMYAEEEDIHRRIVSKKTRRVVYDKKLKYLHLIDGRAPTLNMMERRWESFIYLHVKNKLSPASYIRRELGRLRSLYYIDYLRNPCCGERRRFLGECIGILRRKN